jgi:hypothetical protein
LAQAIFKPYLFPYKYSNILKPSHSSYLSAYEDGTECSETLAYKIQMPGNYPEESIQQVNSFCLKITLITAVLLKFQVFWDVSLDG